MVIIGDLQKAEQLAAFIGGYFVPTAQGIVVYDSNNLPYRLLVQQ